MTAKIDSKSSHAISEPLAALEDDGGFEHRSRPDVKRSKGKEMKGKIREQTNEPAEAVVEEPGPCSANKFHSASGFPASARP